MFIPFEGGWKKEKWRTSLGKVRACPAASIYGPLVRRFAALR
jgi:hypothetical protein